MSSSAISKQTISFAAILIVTGVGGYFVTGRQSITALIPAFIGLPILITGLLSLKPSREKAFSIVALVLTLAGLGGSAPGLLKLVPLIQGVDVARPEAVVLKSVMAIFSIIYLIASVRYFISRKCCS